METTTTTSELPLSPPAPETKRGRGRPKKTHWRAVDGSAACGATKDPELLRDERAQVTCSTCLGEVGAKKTKKAATTKPSPWARERAAGSVRPTKPAKAKPGAAAPFHLLRDGRYVCGAKPLGRSTTVRSMVTCKDCLKGAKRSARGHRDLKPEKVLSAAELQRRAKVCALAALAYRADVLAAQQFVLGRLTGGSTYDRATLTHIQAPDVSYTLTREETLLAVEFARALADADSARRALAELVEANTAEVCS